jgi:hypothetical protein
MGERDELRRAHAEVARLRERVFALEAALRAASEMLRPFGPDRRGNGPPKRYVGCSDSGEPQYLEESDAPGESTGEGSTSPALRPDDDEKGARVRLPCPSKKEGGRSLGPTRQCFALDSNAT